MNLDDIYFIDDHFEVEVRDEKILLVDYVNSNWFRTNEEGYQLLKQFDGAKSIADILNDYATSFGASASTIIKRFSPFLARAIERKVLLKEGEEHVVISSPFSKYPNELWIHVTDRCNMSCPFCYSSSYNAGKEELNYEDVIRYVEKIPAEGRKNIIISGGEPFLYKDLLPLLKNLKALGFRITVISNGTCGNEIYAEVIPYIDSLQISIDGTTESIYEFTRGKGNFQKAIKSLHLAHELGMGNIIISFTTNLHNIKDISNLPRFASENHVNHIHITRIIPSGRANDVMDKIVPTSEMYRDAIRSLLLALTQINEEIEINSTYEMLLPEKERTKKVTVTISSDPILKVYGQTKISTCSLANGTFSIGYDGNIYPCGCMQYDEYKVGTLEDNIEDIMNRGLEYCNHFSVDNREMKECYQCKLKYICGGGCRACAHVSGDNQGIDPICSFYKDRIEQFMWNSPIMLK